MLLKLLPIRLLSRSSHATRTPLRGPQRLNSRGFWKRILGSGGLSSIQPGSKSTRSFLEAAGDQGVACADGRRKLCPYPSCYLAHSLELTSFVVDGKAVSNDRRGKAALRAERQPFQRHKAVCLHDATNEVFGRFHLPPFGADQSEDHYLIIWDVPERCKRARPIVVVFEEKPRCADGLYRSWLHHDAAVTAE